MKACVIGATTPAGRVTARALSEAPGVEVSTPGADLPFEQAFPGAEVVVGCLDGDRSMEEQAARAAIRARIPYLSGADSPELFQALSELDEEASEAGTVVVAGLGWTPGITNLMAAMAAAELDAATQVRIAWTGSSLGPLGPSLLSRAIRAFSGDAMVFENDAWRLEAAGKQAEKIFFPEPAGWRQVVSCAAPEPLSLPETLQGVRKVWVKGGVFEPWAHSMALRASDPWAAPSGRPSRLSGPSRALAAVLSRIGNELQAWSAARVDVTGLRSGAEETITLGIVDQLPNLRAAPLVAGVLLLGQKEIRNSGVLSPEEAFDPSKFFALVGQRGVRLARLQPERAPALI